MEFGASLKTNPTVWHWNCYQRIKRSLFPPLCMVLLRFHRNLTRWQMSSAWNIKTAELKTTKKCKCGWDTSSIRRQEQRWKEESSTSRQSPQHFREAVWKDEHAQVSCCTWMLLLNLSSLLLLLYFITLSGHCCCVNDRDGFAGAMTKKGVLRVAFLLSCWDVATWYHSHICNMKQWPPVSFA